MNNVVLIGRLTKDPELRYTAGSQMAVATFNLAIDRVGAKEKTADFIRIKVFGKMAENCEKFLAKGRLRPFPPETDAIILRERQRPCRTDTGRRMEHERIQKDRRAAAGRPAGTGAVRRTAAGRGRVCRRRHLRRGGGQHLHRRC